MLHIVLVNYNNSQDTIGCINSILESNHYGNCSVEIFDNNSNELNANILKKYLQQIETTEFVCSVDCYFSDINLGFAAGNNYWLKKTPIGDYVWFLNNDTLTNSQLFEQIFTNLPDDKSVIYFDCKTFDNEFHDDGMHFVNLLTGRYHSSKKSRYDFGYICGASLLLKKTELTPIWSEFYFLYFEDSDYGMKLYKQGFSLHHLNCCYFNHKISASSSKKKGINYIKLRSQVFFMKKWGKNFPLFVFGKAVYLLFVKNDFIGFRHFLTYIRELKGINEDD